MKYSNLYLLSLLSIATTQYIQPMSAPVATDLSVITDVVLDAAVNNNFGLLYDTLEASKANRSVQIDLNTLKDRNHNANPFLWACWHGNLQMVKYLVEEYSPLSIDLNATTNIGNNALHLAAYNNHLPIVQYLVNMGFDTSKINHAHATALDIALDRENETISNYLIEKTTVIDQPTRQLVGILALANFNRGLAAIALADNPALAAQLNREAPDLASLLTGNRISPSSVPASPLPSVRNATGPSLAPSASPVNNSVTVDQEDTCPICLSQAKERPAAQIQATQCCKKFICKDCYNNVKTARPDAPCPLCRASNFKITPATIKKP